ncbi:MAG: hypothetical protein IPQ07_27590 [Myxococcales bacterium]|nr:hypothetical protein [Myxococcales bacterium]
MPSQRLLKILDPWGHVGPRRVLGSTTPTAILWATDPAVSAWIAAELRAAGIEPLLARSFRHVETSLRDNAHPACALAVIDLAAISPANLERLYTVRWAGYSGPIIGIGGPDVLDARSRTLLSLEALIAPLAPGLRDAVARWSAGAPAPAH